MSAKLKPSVKVALLGQLVTRESESAYGYELHDWWRRTFAEPFGWDVTQAAIYGALRQLSDAHLIRRRMDKRRSDDDSQLASQRWYALEPRGRAAFEAWRTSPMASLPTRKELLLRLHFSPTDEALRQLARCHLRECNEELERIVNLPERTRVERLAKADLRLAVQARLTWTDLLLAELRAPGDGPVGELG